MNDGNNFRPVGRRVGRPVELSAEQELSELLGEEEEEEEQEQEEQEERSGNPVAETLLQQRINMSCKPLNKYSDYNQQPPPPPPAVTVAAEAAAAGGKRKRRGMKQTSKNSKKYKKYKNRKRQRKTRRVVMKKCK